MRILIVIALFGLSISSHSQDISFEVKVSSDTIYEGNRVGIKYTIKNAQGDFEAPEFDAFRIVGGPNVSSQFSMVNGEVTQSASYEYVLYPLSVGTHRIEPAQLIQGDDVLSSDYIELVVVENPYEVVQDFRDYSVSKKRTEIPKGVMTAKDSLLLKLRKVKSKKI